MPTGMAAESGLMNLNFPISCQGSVTGMRLAQYVVIILAIISLHVIGLRLTHER